MAGKGRESGLGVSGKGWAKGRTGRRGGPCEGGGVGMGWADSARYDRQGAGCTAAELMIRTSTLFPVNSTTASALPKRKAW